MTDEELDALVKRLLDMISENGRAIVCNGRTTAAMCKDIASAATAITTLRQQLASAQADEKRGLLLTDLERRAVIEAIRIMFEDGSSEPSHKPAERVLRKLGHPRYS